MAVKKRGLGSGLDALFMENAIEEQSANAAVKLPIHDLEPNKAQPRKTFNEEALQELANSIQLHGVIQPLLVRPLPRGGYQIVAGERRWRASRMAGLDEVPVVIKELTDAQTMELALIENLQREDLNPIEEAEGFQLLMSDFNLTQEEVSQKVGRSRSAVTNALRLLGLPENIKELARTQAISQGHARALLSFTDEKQMNEVAQAIIKGDLSVREVEHLAKDAKESKKVKTVKQKTRDTFFDEVELALSQNLGRKVRIKAKKEKGILELEFFDKNDLKRIAKLLEE